jgi:hypothetical protein
MSILRSRPATSLLILGGLIQAASAPGCGGNSNEKEFLNTAPPGKQTGDPNESYSQRRERTKNASKKAGPVNPSGDNKAGDAKKPG